MKKEKGMPITAARPEYSKKRPFVPDAKETSANEQTMIAEAPQPFKNQNTAAQIGASSAASGGISTLEPKIASGLKRSNVGAKALPPGAPVGQRQQPNQSKQIGGRMGFPPPAKKSGNNAFQSVKRNARFYGE